MLSTSIIKSASHAGHYFNEEDNYYTKEEGKEHSEWFGKGAEKLNYQGQVDSKKLVDLLEGVLPDGQRIGKVVDGKTQHRPGWDLTFSAPKSVSIMALVGRDTRLIKAHHEAVKSTLTEVERACSEVRIKNNGTVTYEYTQNITAALYHHYLSRENDPQLHTHSVIMNLTQKKDGNWRSQASAIGRYDKEVSHEVHGFIERVRNNKRYFGKIYEAELAFQVKQCGYNIAIDPKTGVFEISDIPHKINALFSKRKNQINQHLKEKGFSSEKAADVAAMQTRKGKMSNTKESVQLRWQEEIKEFHFDARKIIDQTKEKDITNSSSSKEVSPKVIQCMHKAMQEISCFKTTFTLEELIMEAAQLSLGNHPTQDLLKAFEAVLEKGDLLKIENTSGKTILMTKETLEDEKKIAAFISQKNTLQSSVTEQSINSIIKKLNLTLPEKNVVKEVFSTQKEVMVEGYHAKQVLTPAINEIAKHHSLNVAIVSPNQITSKVFANELNQSITVFDKVKSFFGLGSHVNYQSTMAFLSKESEKCMNTDKKERAVDLLLVDNAHLLSAKEQLGLLEWSEQNPKTKIIFFSQKNQLLSQRKGMTTDYFSEHGMKTVSLQDKKNTFAYHITEKDLSNIVQKIGQSTVEIKNLDDRLFFMANHFARLPSNKDIYLVANNKKNVEQLNILAHEALKKENKLKECLSVKVLIPQFLSENRSLLATSYPKGHIVRFNQPSSNMINKGEYLTIESHDKHKNEVTFKKKNGQLITWQPQKGVEIFKEVEREFSVGERLQCQRSLAYAGLTKSETAIVTGLTGSKLKLSYGKGKTLTIDTAKPHHCHFDYGYANLPHNLAHEKPKMLIAELPSFSFQTHQRTLFQLVAQPHKIALYTDDISSLFKTIEDKTGEKLFAQDILRESSQYQKSWQSFYDILQKSLEKQGESNVILSKKAIHAVDFAIRHLSEREAGFTHKELMYTALQHALGDVSQQEHLNVIKAMEVQSILLKGKDQDGTLWTTQETVKTERLITHLCLEDKGKLQPVVASDIVQKYTESSFLHEEQVAAIHAITQSKDRTLAIQGRAGTGKTTMMTSLAAVLSAKELLKEEGYTLIGIAPTHKAVKELTARGIPSQTIDSFLLDKDQLFKGNFSKTILIIDEASMVSNQKMLDILSLSIKANFRQIIPTGDVKQLPAIEQGKPFYLMQNNIDPLELKFIRRQKNPILQAAVKAIYDGNYPKAFSVLGESIIEIKDDKEKLSTENINEQKSHYGERIKAIVVDYMSFSKEARETVQIITPSHKDRLNVNAALRSALTKEGSLGMGEHSFSILRAHNMTEAEKSQARYFSEGQVIKFSKTIGKEIKHGDYFKIEKIDSSYNLLHLAKLNNLTEKTIWQIPQSSKGLNKTIQVFNQEERHVSVGEKIAWTYSNKKENILTTDSVKVLSIKNNILTVERPDKSVFSFDAKEPTFQHWDHGYAMTAHAVQGGTYPVILGFFESYRQKLMSQKTFLVTVTRAVDICRIYTNDKASLLKSIQTNLGDKISALEVIEENNKRKTIKLSIPSKIKSPAESTFNKEMTQEIKQKLNEQAGQLAISILGEPKLRGSYYLKFGSKQGSLSVTISGEKQGWWHDFATGKGGRSILSLIKNHNQLTSKEAIRFGAKWLGILTDTTLPKDKIAIKNDFLLPRTFNHSLTDYQQKMLNKAKKIAAQSVNIQGTLAEVYLKKHRGLSLKNIPADLRFHPGIYSSINQKKLPALVGIVRNKDDEIKAVEAIFLDEKTGGTAENVKIGKQTFGAKAQGSLLINQGKEGSATILAEGAVTALSVAEALPHVTVKALLGKQLFNKIDPNSLSQKVIFCLDYDGKELQKDPLVRQAAVRLQAEKEVHLMIPKDIKSEKYDYNDVLKLRGISAIEKDYKEAILVKYFYHEPTKNNDILAYAHSIKDIPINDKLPSLMPSISEETITKFVKNEQQKSYQKTACEESLYQSLQKQTEPTISKNFSIEQAKSIELEREI